MAKSRNSAVTPHVAASFRRFFQLLPKNGDKELTVLKCHLLVEEQIRLIIAERLQDPESFKRARLSFRQCVYLAKSFFPPEPHSWIWETALKLNDFRNDIAHRLELGDLTDRMNKLIKAHPTGFHELEERENQFDLVVWSLFTALSQLVEKPSAQVLELVSSDESSSI